MYLPAISNLLKLRGYLDRYVTSVQPAAFEFLVAVAFHRIFCLPFQSKNIEDNTVNNRIIWYGQIDKKNNRFYPSPSGPDSMCFAYGFDILIECTLRGNVSSQWRKEFVESLKHYDKFSDTKGPKKENVFLLLVAPAFHNDTYTGFKQKAIEGYNIVMFDCSTLAKICKICASNSTIRHLDLRFFMKKAIGKLRNSCSLADFRNDIFKLLTDWEVDLLKQEKTAYFGLKSYEAMKKVGKKTVGISDIMLLLQGDKRIEGYIRKLGGGDLSTYIRDGLINEKLARLIETPTEDFFHRVDYSDFRARGLRFIKAVESIDRQL